MAITDSILDSIKKLLGIAADDTNFDVDIIIGINTVLATLYQLGVGPSGGFTIADQTTNWTEVLNGDKRLEFVKSYIYIKVRLLFDPPQSSVMVEALERTAKDLEFRISIADDIDSEV